MEAVSSECCPPIHAGIMYRRQFTQAHGDAYVVAFSTLFILGQTAVWWDARLLFKKFGSLRHPPSAGTGRAGGVAGSDDVPELLLPLVHGAWLVSWKQAAGFGGGGKLLLAYRAPNWHVHQCVPLACARMCACA